MINGIKIRPSNGDSFNYLVRKYKADPTRLMDMANVGFW